MNRLMSYSSLITSHRPAGWAALAGVCLIAAVWRYGHFAEERRTRAAETALLERSLPGTRPDAYVSSNVCRSCHPGEYHSWHRTYHRTMTQVARPENVLGRFDGTTVASRGLDYRVFREGASYWAEMPDPEELMYVVQGGKPTPLDAIPRVARRVVMATGSHHYQTYWVAGDKKYGNLLQTLPLVFLPQHDRWIPREAAFMRPPGERRMVTQWNHHCIRCHSTGGVPGLNDDSAEGSFDTQVAELGISCEACHGPAAEHIRKHQNPLTRYATRFTAGADQSVVNPAKLDHRRSSQVCGQCHGVFIMEGELGMKYAYEGVQFRPGDDLHETRHMIEYPTSESTDVEQEAFARNRPFFRERWWPDGTMLAGGREFTGLAATGCYERGTISCLSCHAMHESDPDQQLKPEMDGNQACTTCHSEPRFLADLASHTHHPAESLGSRCMNCHMPHTSYALFRAIRNHRIDSPRTTSNLQVNLVNACNACHLDQTLTWTADHLATWYGQPPVDLSGDEREIAAGVLWMLKGDAAVRVVAAWHAGWEGSHAAAGEAWLPAYLAALLADPYGVVRYVSHRSLMRLKGFEDFAYDFLADPKKLSQAAEAAGIRWANLQAGALRPNPALLIDSSGQLMAAPYRRLLGQRDHRPVTIQE